jgi:hypothetical protein
VHWRAAARRAKRSKRAHSNTLTKLLVDLELHRQAVAVPAEAAGDVVPRLACVARHNVLREIGRGGG